MSDSGSAGYRELNGAIIDPSKIIGLVPEIGGFGLSDQTRRRTLGQFSNPRQFMVRRFNSEVQQRCIDDMAEHRGWGKGRGQGRKSPAAMRT